jgi:hypothetical protein
MQYHVFHCITRRGIFPRAILPISDVMAGVNQDV